MGSVQPPSMQCAAYNKLGVVSCGRGTIDTSRCGMHDKLWEFVLALCNAHLELEEPPSLTTMSSLEVLQAQVLGGSSSSSCAYFCLIVLLSDKGCVLRWCGIMFCTMRECLKG